MVELTPRRWGRGSAAAGAMLILIAVVGKIAFLNLKAAVPASVWEGNALLQVHGKAAGDGAGLVEGVRITKGEKLRDRLRLLEGQQHHLKAELQAVREAQMHQRELKEEQRRAVLAGKQHVASLSAEKQTLGKERDQMLSQLRALRGHGTQQDEGLVQLIQRAERDKQQLKEVEDSLRAQREEGRVVRDTEADVAADRSLRAKGLGGKGAMATKKQVALAKAADERVELQKEANEQLARSNAELEREIARHKKAMKTRLYGSKALEAAGVQADSWGPLTATVATKQDPRNSFAVLPEKEKVAVLKQNKAAAVPKAKGPPMTQADLQKDLGFPASILNSKAFKSTWAR